MSDTAGIPAPPDRGGRHLRPVPVVVWLPQPAQNSVCVATTIQTGLELKRSKFMVVQGVSAAG